MNLKSNIIKYVVTAVSSLTVMGGASTALIFGTDTIIAVDEESAYTTPDVERITVDTVISELVKDEQTPSINDPDDGDGSTPPPVPGVTPPSPPSPPSPPLSTSAEEVKQKLLNSEYKDKAESLATIYDFMVNDFGYSVNAAIGLMANVVGEGNYGLVEWYFAYEHRWDFYLPSGSTGKIKNMEDFNKVKEWDDVSDYEKDPDTGKDWGCKKGSCGVGSLQWSFDRRTTFLDIASKYIKCDADINDANWRMAEIEMFKGELSGSKFTDVAAKISTGSVEEWAEAFCDVYIRPKERCPGSKLMSGTGEACKTRRETAGKILEILNN